MSLPPKTKLRVVQCRVATLWKRALAYMIDEVILLMLLQLLVTGFGPTRFATAIFVLLSALYAIICVYRFGGTVGKLVLGLRITSINAMPVSVLQSSLRYAPYLVSGILSVLVGTDEMMMQGSELPADVQFVAILSIVWMVASIFALVSSPERRTLHDHLAYTMVVEIRPVEKD